MEIYRKSKFNPSKTIKQRLFKVFLIIWRMTIGISMSNEHTMYMWQAFCAPRKKLMLSFVLILTDGGICNPFPNSIVLLIKKGQNTHA